VLVPRDGPLDPRTEAACRPADTADLDDAARVLLAVVPRLEAAARGWAAARLGLAAAVPR